jgi:hypothetical protein
MSLRPLVCFFGLAALSSGLAHAGVVSGQVRDSQGNPVRNATFQVEMMSSTDDPIVLGGFTDTFGNFTTTITPNGDYRITIFPQPAPQSLVVVERFENITVGTTPNNLGTIVLDVGTLLTGRVLNSSGTPLVGVSLGFRARSRTFNRSTSPTPTPTRCGYFSGRRSVRFLRRAFHARRAALLRRARLGTAEPVARHERTDAISAMSMLPPGFGISANVQQPVERRGPIEGLELEVVDASDGRNGVHPQEPHG